MDPELTVVIPVYNNSATLEELHRQLTVALRPLLMPYEILFVDDTSRDSSLSELQRLADGDERVAAVALAENVGQNRAVLAGLAHARGEVLMVMDADLQDPPAAVPLLVAHLCAGRAAAVFAGRRGRYESFRRLFASRLLKGLLHLLTLGRLPADAGLFVAMRREMADQLLARAGSNAYLLGLMARTGLKLESIPVERGPAPRSGYSGGMRLRLALRAVWSVVGPVPERSAGWQTPPIADLIGARFKKD